MTESQAMALDMLLPLTYKQDGGYRERIDVNAGAPIQQRWKQAKRSCLRWYRHLRPHQLVAAILFLCFVCTTEPIACFLHCQHHVFAASAHTSVPQQNQLHSDHALQGHMAVPASHDTQGPQSLPVANPVTCCMEYLHAPSWQIGQDAIGHASLDTPSAGSDLRTGEPEHEHLASLGLISHISTPHPVAPQLYDVRAGLPPARWHPLLEETTTLLRDRFGIAHATLQSEEVQSWSCPDATIGL